MLEKIAKPFPAARRIARRLRGLLNALRSLGSPFIRLYPAGHFQSPLPDVRDIRRRGFGHGAENADQCPGIDIREHDQLALLEKLSVYYGKINFPDDPRPGVRFYYRNDFYSYGDATILAAMMQEMRPRRIVEIGSGFSSAVILDVNDQCLNGTVQCTFVDPFPDRIMGLMNASDRSRHQVLRVPVQDVDLRVFGDLAANDMLLVDSSHVVKAGSDVSHILFNIIPRLQTGVIVHFHDIHWPFEYSLEWLEAGHAWNEAYFLRAFLQYNSAFQILYFNAFIASVHGDLLAQKMPLCMNNPGASLWLRRVI